MQKIYKDICCRNVSKILKNCEFEIWYNPVTRGFGLYDRLIDSCPICGKKLPVELADFYNEIQEKEFGITRENYRNLEKKGLIPKEFGTDEWWLKRQHYPNFPNKILTDKQRLKQFADIVGYTDKDKENLYKQFLNDEIELKKNIDHFCCTRLLLRHYSVNKLDSDSHSMILFEPEKRRFLLKSMPYVEEKVFHKRRPKRLLLSQCFYCPWCGKELPKSLASLWFKIVTTEFGVTDIFNQNQLAKKLPPEFLTEQWWRQRGL